MRDFLQTWGKEILAVIGPALIALAAYFLRPLTKLRWATRYDQIMLIDDEVKDDKGQIQKRQSSVRTRTVFIQNLGRAAATNVEVVFNWKPRALHVWPQRTYQVATNPEDRHVVLFSSLATKEFVGIDLFSVDAELPGLVNIRSSEGSAIEVQMRPQVVPSTAMVAMIFSLIALGAITLAYGLITAVQWAYERFL